MRFRWPNTKRRCRRKMATDVILMSHPIPEGVLERPGRALADGDIVAFPTETVYGLGASAYRPEAVARIFQLKGRPSDNPLIVHLPSDEHLSDVVSVIPETFSTLYRAFSPGPLTYVMPKSDRIPDVVTAGLSTVAVRFPSQPTARALFEAAGVPVVAPSANVSGRPSPTRARHVLDDFAGRIPFIIDDGPCDVGVESTVIDLTSDPIRILRPGIITASDILEKTGLEAVPWTPDPDADRDAPPPSPGMKYRHYAPNAPVEIVDAPDAHGWVAAIGRHAAPGRRIAAFMSEAMWDDVRGAGVDRTLSVYTYPGPPDAVEATRHLFDALRTLDRQTPDIILAEGWTGEVASAYMDRLKKASAPRPPQEVLFVCTGNTCRSPMAEALFNARCGSDRVHATSAGMAAWPGMPITDAAVTALREVGIDAEAHRARQLDVPMLEAADLVIAMTAAQRDALRRLAPTRAERMLAVADVRTDGRDVDDPYGQALPAYRRARDMLSETMDAIRERAISMGSKSAPDLRA